MRTLPGRGRSPQNLNHIPFKAMIPLRLKNVVSGKGDSTSEVSCVYEMSVVFACLKDNEFSEKFCEKEISLFQKCYKDHMSSRAAAKSTMSQGIISTGNKLTSTQLNKYLRRYPNPK